MGRILKLRFAIACGVMVAVCGSPRLSRAAQPQKTSAETSLAAALEHAMNLASTGRCSESLPTLMEDLPHIKDKKFLYAVAMLSAQCGMSLDQEDAVVKSLLVLNQHFPGDPKVLYITTRYYSELANRTAHRLLKSAPTSAEAQQLLAQSYQERGQYQDAIAEYRRILKQYPDQPDVHYQIARIILVKPLTSESAEEARKELEEELRVNPGSPAAEFILGDLDMRQQKNEEAIKHFTRATELDVALPQPYLGLGMVLNTEGKHAEAIPVLKKFVELQPGDPAGYYQLAIAYSRMGNKGLAQRAMELQREAEKHWNPGPSSDEMMQPH